MSNGSRPGLLNTGDPSYPWLADSWPATSLPVNNSNSGPNEIGNFGRGDVLPPVPGQGDKTATMLSDGAIYSSIDFTTKTTYNSSSQITQATPYATTQILHSNSIHELAVDLPDPQWKSSVQQKSDLMGFAYSLPDQNKGNNAMTVIAGAHHYQCKPICIREWKTSWKRMKIASQHLLFAVWPLHPLSPLGSSPLPLLHHPHGRRCNPCCKLTWMS